MKKASKVISIAIIDGSPRKESFSRILAYAVKSDLESRGIVVRFFDQSQQHLPLFDDEPATTQTSAVQALFETVRGAHGIILCSPEYHNSMSGALKNALDWLSRIDTDAYAPMILCGLIGGDGAMGNSGALLQMMMAVRSMKWWLMPDTLVSVSNIWDACEQGVLTETAALERVAQFGEKFVKYSKAFRRIEPDSPTSCCSTT